MKESINVVIENASPDPQDEYFLPFTSEQMEKIGGFEVKDRKNSDIVGFTVDAVDFDPSRCVRLHKLCSNTAELPLTADLIVTHNSTESNCRRLSRPTVNRHSASLSTI